MAQGEGDAGTRSASYRDRRRHDRKSPFPSKSAAHAHFRDVIEPQLRGDPASRRQLTMGEFVPIYLRRHAVSVRGADDRHPA